MIYTSQKNQSAVMKGWGAKFYIFFQSLMGVRGIHKVMLSLMEIQGDSKILDIGCGGGNLLFSLWKKYGDQVELFGIDPSEDMIQYAKKQSETLRAPIDFQIGSAEFLNFPDEHFDWVVSSLVPHHLPLEGKEKMFKEIRRVLKTNGRMLISDFGSAEGFKKNLIELTFRKHAFSKDNFEGKLFKIIQSEFPSAEVASKQLGVFHHIIAKKN